MTRPLKLLVYRPTLADGGADRVTVTLLEHLDRQRFATTLVLNRRVGVLANEVPADVKVVDLGVRRLALAIPALVRAIRTLDPDVILCTAGGANAVVSAAHALARSHARLVLSERSAVMRPERSAVRNAWELPLKRAMYRRAACVTAVSQGVADGVREVLHVDPNKICVVGNPIVRGDLASLAKAPLEHGWLPATAEAPVAVAIGRLVEVKDYRTMLEALALVRRDIPLKLIVLGIGPERQRLAETVSALNLDSAVDFVGYQTNVPAWVARATLMLQTSRAEGLPGALISAIATGVPVVATDCDHGPREVVDSGRTGLLVPVGNPAAVAQAALRILREADWRPRCQTLGPIAMRGFHIDVALVAYQQALAPIPARAGTMGRVS